MSVINRENIKSAAVAILVIVLGIVLGQYILTWWAGLLVAVLSVIVWIIAHNWPDAENELAVEIPIPPPPAVEEIAEGNTAPVQQVTIGDNNTIGSVNQNFGPTPKEEAPPTVQALQGAPLSLRTAYIRVINNGSTDTFWVRFQGFNGDLNVDGLWTDGKRQTEIASGDYADMRVFAVEPGHGGIYTLWSRSAEDAFQERIKRSKCWLEFYGVRGVNIEVASAVQQGFQITVFSRLRAAHPAAVFFAVIANAVPDLIYPFSEAKMKERIEWYSPEAIEGRMNELRREVEALKDKDTDA
jgi:hypothetical protein